MNGIKLSSDQPFEDEMKKLIFIYFIAAGVGFIWGVAAVDLTAGIGGAIIAFILAFIVIDVAVCGFKFMRLQQKAYMLPKNVEDNKSLAELAASNLRGYKAVYNKALVTITVDNLDYSLVTDYKNHTFTITITRTLIGALNPFKSKVTYFRYKKALEAVPKIVYSLQK